MWAWREPRRAERGRAKCARSNLCCCTAAAPWISRSACHHFRTASPLLALSVAGGVGRCSGLCVDAARPPREAAGGGGVGLGPSMDFFLHDGAWFLPFAGTRAAPGRRQPPARCSTGVVRRPCGASAGDPGRHRAVVGGSGGRGSRAGCSIAAAGLQTQRRFGDRLAPLRRCTACHGA